MASAAILASFFLGSCSRSSSDGGGIPPLITISPEPAQLSSGQIEVFTLPGPFVVAGNEYPVRWYAGDVEVGASLAFAVTSKELGVSTLLVPTGAYRFEVTIGNSIVTQAASISEPVLAAGPRVVVEQALSDWQTRIQDLTTFVATEPDPELRALMEEDLAALSGYIQMFEESVGSSGTTELLVAAMFVEANKSALHQAQGDTFEETAAFLVAGAASVAIGVALIRAGLQALPGAVSTAKAIAAIAIGGLAVYAAYKLVGPQLRKLYRELVQELRVALSADGPLVLHVRNGVPHQVDFEGLARSVHEADRGLASAELSLFFDAYDEFQAVFQGLSQQVSAVLNAPAPRLPTPSLSDYLPLPTEDVELVSWSNSNEVAVSWSQSGHLTATLQQGATASACVVYFRDTVGIAMAPTSVQVSVSGLTVEPIGVLPGHDRSIPIDMSGDGSVVVGESYAPGAQHPRLFFWRQGSALREIELLPGSPSGDGVAVSLDGNTVICNCHFPHQSGTPNKACVWTESGGMQELAGLPGNWHNVAFDLSGNGHVIVGVSVIGGVSHAVRWVGGAVQDLGTLAMGAGSDHDAYLTNSDGTIIYGRSTSSGGFSGGDWKWTPAAGMTLMPQSYIGGILSYTLMSYSGEHILGRGWVGNQAGVWIWSEATGTQIVVPSPAHPAALTPFGTGISGDAMTLFGGFSQTGAQTDYHWRWTQAGGMQSIGQLGVSRGGCVNEDGNVWASQIANANGVIMAVRVSWQ